MSRAGTRTGIRAALAVLCVAVAPLACAPTPRSIAIPRVEVTQLSALPAGASGQRFRVELMIDNQNPEPLPIAGVRFTLRIAGQGVLTADYKTQVTVEALDRRTLQIEVAGDTLSSLSQLRANAGAGNTLAYEMFGTITLDRSFQNMLPFTAMGALPLAAATAR